LPKPHSKNRPKHKALSKTVLAMIIALVWSVITFFVSQRVFLDSIPVSEALLIFLVVDVIGNLVLTVLVLWISERKIRVS
jgi:Zn-dependent protease with chaperone function